MATPGAPEARVPVPAHLVELAQYALLVLNERLAGERNTQVMRAARDRAVEQADRRGVRGMRLRGERDEARRALENEKSKVRKLRGVLERRVRELRAVEGRIREHHETHVCKRKRPTVFVCGDPAQTTRGAAAAQPAATTRRSSRGVPRVNYRALAGRG
ncbi:MAG: hypothetical protein Q9187_000809 [Circinaria calcarea]